MTITLRLAWRNLWRYPRRTWLTASAIAFVTLLMVFLITLQLGSYDLMVDSSLRIFTGQLQVQREGYLDKPQIRTVVPEALALAQRMRQSPALANVGIAARAQGFALASSGRRSYGVQVVGAEPEHEPRVSTIPRLMKSGRYLSRLDAPEAVVGATLARNLNIKVGDELTLLGSAMDGSVAATVVPVVGLFESGMRELDRQLVELPLRTFQETFGMGDAGHAIVLVAPDLKALPQLRTAVAALLPEGRGLVALDWERLIPGLKQLIQADWASGWFTYIALIVVVTFSILNTFIMSVLERTREFGAMLALGATPARIGVLVFFESLFLTLIGLALGMGLGLLVAFYFSVYGFTYPGLAELMGQYGLPGLIYPKLSFVSVALGPAVILGFVLLASLYPALRIRRLNAVEAMHAV
ncbi:MAG: lipoprotein ABC transporter permease [Candidatus Muproteobacteria bacterium RBG_16_65_34]|uniref:Lipoprotein ABC transporter permease n=1 Tax=Candidatus Muproteobacteria bacterium RBG_16_65_34 TaxID=1817760 RepID=A0A1F6TSB3_9PROT|nr:MAG: lipoprotein ABC transporter permease [Candidatus Muproteobacteria bacterium RBG_16_65_34]